MTAMPVGEAETGGLNQGDSMAVASGGQALRPVGSAHRDAIDEVMR